MRVLVEVVEAHETRDELAEEEVMGVVDGPHAPVGVVVGVDAGANRIV